MSLVDQLRTPPSAFHRERLKMIDGFDFGPVAQRIAEEEKSVPPERINDVILFDPADKAFRRPLTHLPMCQKRTAPWLPPSW